MNKGIEKWLKSKEKKKVKRHTIKDSQKDLKRKVEITYPIFKKINGKWKMTEKRTKKGIQVENKVFLKDGSYIYVNKKGVKIKVIGENHE